MPRRKIEVLPVNDFTGGLNLVADAFQLRDHESPDLLNVDVSKDGGFQLRKAFGVYGSSGAMDQAITNLMTYTNRSGTKQVVIAAGNSLLYGTGAAWTNVTTSDGVPIMQTVTTVMRGATFLNPTTAGEALYIQNGTDGVRKWTGANHIPGVLTQTFSDDLAAPNNGDMPVGRCIAAHANYVWVGNTLESATRYPNRVRFSHPNKCEDWRTNDYIDINPSDGDEITALVSHEERLYIFKNRSVHVITGVGPTSFANTKVFAGAGAPTQEACVETEHGIYFYSVPDGLFRLQGNNTEWLFERLAPATKDGRIPSLYTSGVKLGWLDRRVWISLPWGASATANNRTFVFDPTLGNKNDPGAFTAYDMGFTAFLNWNPGTQAQLNLAARADQYKVMRVEVEAAQDTLGVDYLALDGTTTSFVSAPDSAALSVVGDLTIDAKVRFTDWTPASVQTIVAKWGAGGSRSYMLQLKATGVLSYSFSVAGTTVVTKDSTVAASTIFADGVTGYVRVVHDVNNGAAGYDVKFYTSTDGLTWSQLGATVTTATATSIFDATSVASLGGHTSGTEALIGRLYWAKIWSGDIDATRVLKGFFDATAMTATTDTTYTDSVATVWTLEALAVPVSARDRNISSHYVTRWFDGENSALIKKWKRPEFVVDGDSTVALRVSVYLDYTPDDVRRSFLISPTADGEYLVWDDGTTAANMTWYDGTTSLNVWALTTDGGSQEILRGSLLGRGRAVQFKVRGPETSVPWAVNAINMKFLPKRIRG